MFKTEAKEVEEMKKWKLCECCGRFVKEFMIKGKIETIEKIVDEEARTEHYEVHTCITLNAREYQ